MNMDVSIVAHVGMGEAILMSPAPPGPRVWKAWPDDSSAGMKPNLRKNTKMPRLSPPNKNPKPPTAIS
jgi:hypothetical protein